MSATTNNRRLIAGLLLAPLAPGLLLLAVSLFGAVGEGLWAMKVMAIFAYPTMIILGLPIHLLFKRAGWTRLWPYLIAGALSGLVVSLVVFPSVHIFAPGQGGASSIAIAVLAAFFGALSALTFWLIVRPQKGPETAI